MRPATLLACAVIATATCLPGRVSAADASEARLASDGAPIAVAAELGRARLAGRGSLRWFGLRVYEASLWLGERFEPRHPASSSFALQLTYARAFRGDAIADRSADEIERLGAGDATQRAQWHQRMRELFPDVVEGDRIVGIHRPGAGVAFFHNDRLLGRVPDPAFADAFFGIWFDPRTNAPGLRAELLREAGS